MTRLLQGFRALLAPTKWGEVARRAGEGGLQCGCFAGKYLKSVATLLSASLPVRTAKMVSQTDVVCGRAS
jgi:hypothetical protein